ncbi:MAG: hypothetical protein O3A46_00235 [Candidatus Poribacteria bacterium]|nr:hypothetical protein [Candidatus Poribacteria bacterium]
MQTEQAVDSSGAQKGRIRVRVDADVNIAAPIARRLVNVELMKKIGQMVMTGEPELLVEGEHVYWKVPLLVVPPEDDPNTYPTGRFAYVDAIAGRYALTKTENEALRKAAYPILKELYPEPEEGMVE